MPSLLIAFVENGAFFRGEALVFGYFKIGVDKVQPKLYIVNFNQYPSIPAFLQFTTCSSHVAA